MAANIPIELLDKLSEAHKTVENTLLDMSIHSNSTIL